MTMDYILNNPLVPGHSLLSPFQFLTKNLRNTDSIKSIYEDIRFLQKYEKVINEKTLELTWNDTVEWKIKYDGKSERKLFKYDTFSQVGENNHERRITTIKRERKQNLAIIPLKE